jgi:hypothetical protein
MTRLFELSSQDAEGAHLLIVELDKVVMARFQKQDGHLYQHIVVRFVDGHEDQDLVRPGDAQRFLQAYRDYLSGRPAGSARSPLFPEVSPAADRGRPV